MRKVRSIVFLLFLFTCSDFMSLNAASGRWWRSLLWSIRSSTLLNPAKDLSWRFLMLLNLPENKTPSVYLKRKFLCWLILKKKKKKTPKKALACYLWYVTYVWAAYFVVLDVCVFSYPKFMRLVCAGRPGGIASNERKVQWTSLAW